MEVIRGSDRLVVPVGEYVLKLPRSSVRAAARDIRNGYEQFGLSYVKRKLAYGPDIYQSSKWYLFRGLIANQREARLAKAFPDIVLQTRSILGGMLNVQPQAKPVTLSGEEIAGVFVEQVGTWITNSLGHMIKHPENFGVCGDGNVRFVDGGSGGLERAIFERGKHDQIAAALQEIGIANSELHFGS